MQAVVGGAAIAWVPADLAFYALRDAVAWAAAAVLDGLAGATRRTYAQIWRCRLLGLASGVAVSFACLSAWRLLFRT